jgi:hypothetical protein
MSEPRPICTCLPLNRKLMALLLKVDEGSVHEQGCVEYAVAAERERIAGEVERLREAHPMLLVKFGPDATPEEIETARQQIEALRIDVDRLARALGTLPRGSGLIMLDGERAATAIAKAYAALGEEAGR